MAAPQSIAIIEKEQAAELHAFQAEQAQKAEEQDDNYARMIQQREEDEKDFAEEQANSVKQKTEERLLF